MKAGSILRHLHNSLDLHIFFLEDFLDNKSHFFETDDKEQEKEWCFYLDVVVSELGCMKRWARGMQQRMERFDAMRDGVRIPLCLRLQSS